MHRVYWVDPETGVLLKITEDEDLYLVSPATAPAVTHLFRRRPEHDAGHRRAAGKPGRPRTGSEIALAGTARACCLRPGGRARAWPPLPARRAGRGSAAAPAAARAVPGGQ